VCVLACLPAATGTRSTTASAFRSARSAMTNGRKLTRGPGRCSVGDSYSLCLTADGELFAFGYNVYGQLGLGDTTNRYSPTALTSLEACAPQASVLHQPQRFDRKACAPVSDEILHACWGSRGSCCCCCCCCYCSCGLPALTQIPGAPAVYACVRGKHLLHTPSSY
jgi:hypothetical protein